MAVATAFVGALVVLSNLGGFGGLPDGCRDLGVADPRERRHRGAGGLGDAAPSGLPGPVPLRPGAHRDPGPPGDGLLRRRPAAPEPATALNLVEM